MDPTNITTGLLIIGFVDENEKNRHKCVHTHKHKYTLVVRHSGTDKRVQQSGDLKRQFYSLTYPLINPPHLRVCFIESFISVASSTVFHGVKIEAIILPNAYLPALSAPSCTPRLLHDEVADMFHTPSITICTLDEPQPAQLILMHVWYALWGWETHSHMYAHTNIIHFNKEMRKLSPIQI